MNVLDFEKTYKSTVFSQLVSQQIEDKIKTTKLQQSIIEQYAVKVLKDMQKFPHPDDQKLISFLLNKTEKQETTIKMASFHIAIQSLNNSFREESVLKEDSYFFQIWTTYSEYNQCSLSQYILNKLK